MPLGTGYWYDRRRRRYLTIHDHAIDACERPKTFRLKPAWVEGLNPVTDRAKIIKLVAREGFTRVRHHRAWVAWQFWGDPISAIDELRGYFSRFEVGPIVEVTFTDLAVPDDRFPTFKALAKDFANPNRPERLQQMLNQWATRDVEV